MLDLSHRRSHVANELLQFVHPCYFSIPGGGGGGGVRGGRKFGMNLGTLN